MSKVLMAIGSSDSFTFVKIIRCITDLPLKNKITKNSFKKSQIGHKIETPKNRKKLKQSSKTKLVNFTNFRKLIFPNRKNKNKYRKKKTIIKFYSNILKIKQHS